jgi:hypothetical protein
MIEESDDNHEKSDNHHEEDRCGGRKSGRLSLSADRCANQRAE